MEDIQSKIRKMSDEKYCSECGEIIKLKAEICPKCGVRQLPAFWGIEGYSNDKKLGEKFVYATGTTFVILLCVVLIYLPQEDLRDGIVGALLFSLVSGGIAMAIPTIRKIIYLPISIAIILAIAMSIAFFNNSGNGNYESSYEESSCDSY